MPQARWSQPHITLDGPLSNPNIPSPFLAKIIESKLARALSKIGPATSLSDFSTKSFVVEEWLSALPPVFAFNNPDKRWDVDCSFLEIQRVQLHCVAYMSQLVLLRPLATIAPSTDCTEHRRNEQLATVALLVETSSKAMAMNGCLWELCLAQQAGYFFVPFCIFDNAALLCSLLSHDLDGYAISRRNDIITTIGTALSMLESLRPRTKLGEVAWNLLNALTSKLDLRPAERDLLDQSAVVSDRATLYRSSSSDQAPRGPSDQHLDGPLVYTDEQWPFLHDGSLWVDQTPQGVQDMDAVIFDGIWEQ